MAPSSLFIVSIHDEEPDRPVLAIDLKHILAALAPYSSAWKFCITSLDAVGDKAAALCEAVYRAHGRGIWLSPEELVQHAAQIEQTIDGKILAFPKEIDPQTVTDDELDLRNFLRSRAILAIVAVDSSFFELYAKDRAIVEQIRRAFRDVKENDPADYFE